jgi:hypothetical protein
MVKEIKLGQTLWQGQVIFNLKDKETFNHKDKETINHNKEISINRIWVLTKILVKCSRME